MGAPGAGPFESGSVPEAYRRHLEPVIFAPWAERLVGLVGLEPGQRVLDVASGTGVVARAAAVAVGPRGRVIASDISPSMLAIAAADPGEGSAPIETLECSATALELADGAVDMVLCQQGFPFIPDRAAAAAQMARVLGPGGRVGVAVWLADVDLEPFETYAKVLRDLGVDEPFPGGYDMSGFKMSVAEVAAALGAGGFTGIDVVTRQLELHWPGVEAAALGITGTPYGPAVAALDAASQGRLMAALRRAMTGPDGAVVRPTMTAVLGTGRVA